MTQTAQRHYMSSEQFSNLLKTLKGDATKVDTSQLAILCPMPSEVKAIGGKDSRLVEFIITSDRIDREQDTLAVIYGEGTGTLPENVPGWTTLLGAPALRGTEVSVR